jgi:hypothetical protein
MTDEKLARELLSYIYVPYAPASREGWIDHRVGPVLTALSAARAQALEEAASICDSYDEEMTARAAEEIRALASHPNTKKEPASPEGEAGI